MNLRGIENNVEGDALSLGYYLSDDPYVANQPLGVGSATLYTPQLAVGRLVESASEINSAVARFEDSNGNLDATSSLTTGYSFLTSGAEEVSANLAANGITPEALTANIAPLIGETWQKSSTPDVSLAKPTPGVISLNAHFDYSRALPAYYNAHNLTTNLFTTTDVSNPSPASSFGGTLLFSMGCHSGLDIDDAEVDASIGATTPVADWAKTFADTGAVLGGQHRLRLRRHRHRRLFGPTHGRFCRQPQRVAVHRRGPQRGQATGRGGQRHP